MITYDSGNVLKVIFALKGSVIPRIKWHLFATLVLGLLVSALEYFDLFGRKDAQGNYLCPRPCEVFNFTTRTWDSSACTANDPILYGCGQPVDKQVYSLIGVAISFLLVFRSNLSYGRYWEGRGHLGAVMKATRDLARQCAFFIDGDDHEVVYLRKDMLRLIQLYFHVLRQHLRKEVGPSALESDETVREIATDDEIGDLKDRKRRPLVIVGYLSRRLSWLLHNNKVNELTYQSMDDCISELIGAFNGVDKVASTPLPFPYAQMLFIFLMLYCYSIPFMLVTSYHWGTPFVSLVITFAFFGINAIGLEIEDPFGTDANDLPIDNMAPRGDVRAAMGNMAATGAIARMEKIWEAQGLVSRKPGKRDADTEEIELEVVDTPRP